MSYHLLQSILSVTFLAVWGFIAVTLLSDKLLEARSRRLEGRSPRPHYARRRRARRRRRLATES